MSEEELIKYFKNLTEITKRDNTQYLEVGVEISVEMAEQLIGIIEKQQKEIENSVSKTKIRDKIKELEGHIWKDGYMTKFDKYAIRYLKELLEGEK